MKQAHQKQQTPQAHQQQQKQQSFTNSVKDAQQKVKKLMTCYRQDRLIKKVS